MLTFSRRSGAALFAALAVLGIASWGQERKQDVSTFLRPFDQSVLEVGPVSVIIRASNKGKLSLDGKPVDFKQSAAGVCTATVNSSGGLHELSWIDAAGEQKIKFFVPTEANAASMPAGWKVFKLHPPSAECGTCHVEKQGEWSFKTQSYSETCFDCHDAKAFVQGHAHNDEVLSDCVLCHHPHGSTEPFHLKMSRETACKQCHG
jgi:predicted CXXCH cytochrome family protein